MRPAGPGSAPMRNTSGFPLQQNTQARNSQLNTGRLQNGKLGSGSNWAFSMPMGAPGLSNIQSRNAGGSSSIAPFSQTLGGSQSVTSLDPSEFPSLSGAQQAQPQTTGSAVWARGTSQQSQNLRQQQDTPQSSQQNQRSGQQQLQTSYDDILSSSSQFSNNLDEFRNGQLQGTSQPQTGSIDEFPPLGRDVSNGLTRESSMGIVSERQSNLAQNAGYGAYTNGMAFAGMGQQQRNPLSNPSTSNGLQDQTRITSPPGSSITSLLTSRSPASQGQNGTIGQDKQGPGGVVSDGMTRSSMLDSQRTGRTSDYVGQSSQQASQQVNQQNAFSGEIVESPAGAQQTDSQNVSQMSELDRFGFRGLFATLRSDNEDIRSLATGQDLTMLGLDLNSSEPLYPNFATPFAPTAPQRPLETEYSLPPCYSVANVTPLHDRINGFTDETLFYIFYSSPRDLMQELVAEELTIRRWRYHKVEKMWLTRDENSPNPREVEAGVSEAGYYIWWDWKGWKKVRRQYMLRYEDLHDREATGRLMGNPNTVAAVGLVSGNGGFMGLGR